MMVAVAPKELSNGVPRQHAVLVVPRSGSWHGHDAKQQSLAINQMQPVFVQLAALLAHLAFECRHGWPGLGPLQESSALRC